MTTTLPEGTEAEIRSWVGSDPSTSELAEIWTRKPAVELVALEVLRTRRADIMAEPANFSAEGDVSWNTTANLKMLAEQIGELERLAEQKGLASGASRQITMGRLSRDRRPTR